MVLSAAAVLSFGLLAGFYLQSCTATLARSLKLHTHHLVRQDEEDSNRDKESDGFASGRAWQHKIPPLLHYIYLKGFDAFIKDSKRPHAAVSKTYFEGCQAVHRHWDSVFWDESAALQLLQEHYSWFLPVWESYDVDDKRLDALRVFIMHRFGGMYLDLDVECYRPADESLKDYEVVLQGTGDEGINNAVMASVPGHKIWQHYARILADRSKEGANSATRAPMWMTGTMALSRTVLELIISPERPVSGYLGGDFKVDESLVKIYPIGEWYVPCYGVDLICQRQFETGSDTGDWDMSDIYGRHYFAESANPKIIQEKLKPHNVTRR